MFGSAGGALSGARRRSLACGVFAALVLAGLPDARAQSESQAKVSESQTAQTTTTGSGLPENLMTRRVTLTGGGYFSFSNTDIQVNNRNTNRDGTNVNLEDDLERP